MNQTNDEAIMTRYSQIMDACMREMLAKAGELAEQQAEQRVKNEFSEAEQARLRVLLERQAAEADALREQQARAVRHTRAALRRRGKA